MLTEFGPPFEPVGGMFEKSRTSLDADYRSSTRGEFGGVVAGTTADVEYPLVLAVTDASHLMAGRIVVTPE